MQAAAGKPGGERKKTVIRRTAAFILVLSIALSMLSGCYDRIEIDELTYIIAIGFDKGKTYPIKMTMQYAASKSMAGGESQGGEGGDGKILELITLEAPTVASGLNMANGFIGRQMNMSHTVALFISEELAREGIESFMYGISRYRELRPNMYVAVCRGEAEDFLKSVNPTQDVSPSKYYELVFRSFMYTGFIPNSQFFKFYTDLQSYSEQPVAILAGVSRYKDSEEFDPEQNTAAERGRDKPLEGDYKAGDIPRVGSSKSEIMGLAVFDGPRMIGELDGSSATNYLMVTGEYNYAYISLPDPKFPDEYIALSVFQRKKPERRVEFMDGKPKVQVKVYLDADFFVIQSGYNYEDPEKIPIAEKAASEFFEKGITTFLKRTAVEFESDICGFGKDAKKHFLTWKEWKEYSWLDRYKDADFKVDVDVRIRRTGMKILSSPFESTKKREASE